MKQGWEIKKLGEVCESDLGKTLNQSKDKGELRPYLCAINVLWDKFDFTTLKETRFEESELDRYSVRKGDLLICEGGDIGRAAIWEYDYVIQYQNALHRVRLDKNVNSRFLLLYLRHLKTSGELDAKYGKGVTIKHLVKSSLLSIPIPIPSREEQERIVEELDCLSGVIEKKREQLKELDALAQSIFYQMFGDPITNEKGWEIDRLGNMCDISSSKRIYAHEYCEDGIPFYRGKEITEKSKGNDISVELYIAEDRYNELKHKYGVPQIGDILITAVGTIGNIWVVDNDTPFYFKDGNVLWLQIKDNINPIYFKTLLYNLIDKYKESMANGCAYSALTIVNLKEMQTNKIPFALQQEFANRIEKIEQQKELIKKSIAEVEDLFNSRMSYYFN